MLVHPAKGSILSPNYPDNYPPSTSCNWRLSGTGLTGIVLIVVDIEIEEYIDYMNDYLDTYDENGYINYIYSNGKSL